MGTLLLLIKLLRYRLFLNGGCVGIHDKGHICFSGFHDNFMGFAIANGQPKAFESQIGGIHSDSHSCSVYVSKHGSGRQL